MIVGSQVILLSTRIHQDLKYDIFMVAMIARIAYKTEPES